MRESNFSNPLQNKASVCISAAIYDRRALDCTATLPLINSLNHLAYLTSTSPRIREMVCLDGGLERLIRILRQVPRSPSQPPMRGVITKEMQAVWKWSLAFQCVVNIGVRGSETVRTRVVEAGMVPVAVRVLESYLRIAEAIRDERKREARREEAKLRMERAAESAQLAIEVATPTAAPGRRTMLSEATLQQQQGRTGTEGLPRWTMATNDEAVAQPLTQHSRLTDETRPTTPTEAMAEDFMMATSGSSNSIHRTNDDLTVPPTTATAIGQPAVLAPIDALAVENGTLSASSSASSIVALGVAHAADRRTTRAGPSSGTLSNMTSLEDLAASGSGSEGGDEGDLDGGNDSDSINGAAQPSSSTDNRMQTMEDTTTPRPPRRSLAPLSNAGPSQPANRAPPAAAHTHGVTQVQDTWIANAMATPTAGGALPAARMTDVEQTPRNMATAAPVPVHLARFTQPATAERPANVPRPPPTTEREREVIAIHASDMIYREEEVLLSLQLLAYLSKYAHVRTLFHRDLSTLNVLDPLEALDGHHHHGAGRANVSWSPDDAPKKNVFCIAERYTLRSSKTGLAHFASMGESRIAPEIQYWAGVIMRNACRKDEKQGGIRQCANMLCGKWERQPREFAKCRRCRKAKYCSKQCQSKGWQMGHRFWCSARSDEEHGEGSRSRDKDRPTTTTEPIRIGLGPEGLTTAPADPMQDLAQMNGRMGDQADARAMADTQPHTMDNRMDGHTVPEETTPRIGHPGQASEAHLYAAHGRAQPQEQVMMDGQSHALQQQVATTMAPLRVARRDETPSPTDTPAGPTIVPGRRAVSAIPPHLLPPSRGGGDENGNGHRSRTTSTNSSNADLSDMSEDEMERASRRVLASTIAPTQRSPAGYTLTQLANVHTAGGEALHETPSRSRHPEDQHVTNAGGPSVPTRTDLAGRPLPPPMIANHDGGNSLDLSMTPDNDLLGGRLTPATVDDADTGVFGRGDFDQMIWRGRTPSMEDHPRHRSTTRHDASSASTSQENLSDVDSHGVHHRSPPPPVPGPSMLNSALLLAGQEDATTPRFASVNLHAPLPRQPHRYASVHAGHGAAGSAAAASTSHLPSTLRSGHHDPSGYGAGGPSTPSRHGDYPTALSTRSSPRGPGVPIHGRSHLIHAFGGGGHTDGINTVFGSLPNANTAAMGSAPPTAASFGLMAERNGASTRPTSIDTIEEGSAINPAHVRLHSSQDMDVDM